MRPTCRRCVEGGKTCIYGMELSWLEPVGVVSRQSGRGRKFHIKQADSKTSSGSTSGVDSTGICCLRSHFSTKPFRYLQNALFLNTTWDDLETFLKSNRDRGQEISSGDEYRLSSEAAHEVHNKRTCKELGFFDDVTILDSYRFQPLQMTSEETYLFSFCMSFNIIMPLASTGLQQDC